MYNIKEMLFSTTGIVIDVADSDPSFVWKWLINTIVRNNLSFIDDKLYFLYLLLVHDW